MGINKKVKKLLNNEGSNYILPFFWQHGEDEETLRHYMGVIAECNIGAVCVESRPHPDFCGLRWWADMDVILGEARKRDMKVWILDDSHFPSGYANGAMKNEKEALLRQSVTYNVLATVKGGHKINLTSEQYEKPLPFQKSIIEQHILPNDIKTFDDDQLLGVIAVKMMGCKIQDISLLTKNIKNTDLVWIAPSGDWTIYALHLTRNRGPHRDYINMMNDESCGKLIKAVYEPHYARYKEDFGKTIAGFFSDEPELGNGHLYEMDKSLEEVDDQPWSTEVATILQERWGENWLLYLPLIWDKHFDANLKAKVRYGYMDAVTRSVEKNFSKQIGNWCRERDVEYIGHLIEDNNQHTRTGSSLGHFFRGLAGQDMAGIDNIGGQVLPQCEEAEMCNPFGIKRDAMFYHYALGKLASSAAAIEPLKKGRAMCENFGNYGWEAGVRLMKYLADHFMVRGINRFVPHAFSPKAFPDSDCPPHFYAHGHNPQYRHFGALMRYVNRVCELISDGCHHAPIAILYHAEADWTGGTCMFIQEPAKKLADRQIDYHFVPSDVFAEKKYKTDLGHSLKINTQEYKMLIVPETSFITIEFAKAAAELTACGFPVVFINNLPIGICNGDIENDEHESSTLLHSISACPVIPLDELIKYVDKTGIPEVLISPANNRIRYMHYHNGSDVYYFVNEGSETYKGTISLPVVGDCYAYNAWDNILETVDIWSNNNKTNVEVSIESSKGLIILFDTPDVNISLNPPVILPPKAITLNENWKRSTCSSIEYPVFTAEQSINLPDALEKENPAFAGFVRYEREIYLTVSKKTVLAITDAAEGVELFVNGKSVGIQVVPVFKYDITGFVQEGINYLIIEVATTLERAVEKPEPTNKCGLCGTVTIYQQ